MSDLRTDRPLRILHVTECYEGGVGKAIATYAANTPDFEHHLLAIGRDVDRAMETDLFASVTTFGSSFLGRIRQVGRTSADLQIDLVHAHSSWAGVYTRAAPSDVPVVYQPHGYAFEMSGRIKASIYRFAERLLALRGTAAVATLSPHESSLARSVGSKARIVEIPNAPTVALVETVDRAAAEAPTTMTMTMVGRVCDQKDPAYFTALVAQVRQMSPGVHARWIGGGEETSVKKLEAFGVEVTGWSDSGRLQELLDDSTVYVHSSRYEGFPLSVLDAAARKRPILARAISAFDESPVAQYTSLDSHAQAVVRVFEDRLFREEIVAKGASMLSVMNKDSQHRRLSELYRLAAEK